MASSVQSQKCAMKVQPLGRHRTTRYFAGAAIVAASLLGTRCLLLRPRHGPWQLSSWEAAP